ncbi:MAG: CHAT domain-containing protein [Cyanobacteria bacterium J06560_2]
MKKNNFPARLTRSRLKIIVSVCCFCLSFFFTLTFGLPAFSSAPSTPAVSEDTLHHQLIQARDLQTLGYYRRALLTLTDLNPAIAEHPDSELKVSGLTLLGDLQRTVGDLNAAQTTLENGLDVASALNLAEPTATLHLSLGHTLEAQGDSAAALTHYTTAATLTTTPHLQLRSHLSHLRLQPTNTALYPKIQTLLTTLPADRTTLNARVDFAQLQLANPTVEPATIAQSLAIAIQQAKTLSDPRAQSYALGTLGKLYQKQQQFPDAQSAFQRALTVATDIDAPDIAYRWQWRLAQLFHQQNETDKALTYYENSVENLKLLRGNLIAIAPDLRFNFREQVEPVYREWVDLLLSQSATEEKLAKSRDAIESLQLAELENYLQEPCVPLSQKIDQIIENTASPTAVLYPIILPDRLEIILKLPNQALTQYTVPVSQTDLETQLAQFQKDLRLPFTLNAVKTEAAQLYDWLIRPAEAELNSHNIDTLVFVLDGFLRNIPMAALYDGQHYLIENYSLALAPGLQLVDPQPLQNNELATVIAGLSEPRHGFAELPFVKAEVDQIQQNTPSRVLLNEAFTQTNLTELINNTPFPLVHLATHGQFSADPNDTFILAWDKPIPVGELNQLLRQSEQTRQSAIELLILSACETAAGDRRAALGLAGVAVQAGARSTLASLWNLDDETGALFSNHFYEALQTPNLSKAQALRNAQLKFITDGANPIYQHPRYWAPYVLLGNWL